MKLKSSRLRRALTLSLLLISVSIVLTSVSIKGPWPRLDVGHASPDTSFYVDPPSVINPALTPGETFSVDVKVSDAEYMYSWQVYMGWDGAVLELSDYVYGGFLSDQPEGSTYNQRLEPDWCFLSEATKGSYMGKNAEEGLLLTITFSVKAMGESVLDINHATLTKYVYCITPPAMTTVYDFPKENGYFSNTAVTYTLTVNSDPISAIDFTVDGTPHSTPWSGSLSEGSHTVIMPSTWGIYDFVEWEDASTDPTRIVSLTADKTVTAYYVAREWTLTVNSDPISGVDFTVDSAPYTTPWSDSLIEGSHTIVMPPTWTVGTDEYSFDEWEDASTDPSRTVSLTADKTVTAYYVLSVERYELTIGVDPTEGGTTVPSPDTYFFDAGTEVIVAAMPEDGWTLDHWELDGEDVGSTDSYTVLMNTNHTLIAFFEITPTQHQLTVNSDPISGVDFTVDGVPHSTPWSDLLDEGSYTVVMPSTWTVGTDEYSFDEWEDATTNPTRIISLTDDKTVTAYYVLAPDYWTLTVTSDAISGVDFTVDGTPHSTPWSGSLSEGSHTVIMPSTWGIYDFVEWEDASTDPTRIVSLTADKTVTAYYVAREWTLTVNSDPISGVDFTVDSAPYTTPWSDSLIEGSHTIVMPPTWTVGTDEYSFDEWEDASTDPTRIVTLTSNTDITAYYTLASVGETVVAVDPPVSTAEPSQYFTINLTIANVTNLFSWGARISWPADLLETHKDNVTEGTFLQMGGSTSFTKKVHLNYMDVGCTLLGAGSASGSGTLATIIFKVLDGGNCTLKLSKTELYNYPEFVLIEHTLQDGVFYTNQPAAKFTYTPNPLEYYGRPIVGEIVTFNGTLSYDPDEPYDTTPGGILGYEWDFDDGNTGTGSITTHVYEDPGTYTVTLTVTDDEGESDIVGRPIIGDPYIRIQLHDIAVINVTVAPTTLLPGATVTINVTVLNKGSVAESLNVTVYKDSIPVKTARFIYYVEPSWLYTIPPGENATATIEWDTTGISIGTYTIKVYAFLINSATEESVPGIEKDEVLPDNWMTYGTINVVGPDFELAATPASLSILQGDSDTSTITITSLNDFSDLVALSVSGEPIEVIVTLDPKEVTPAPNGTATSTLTVSVDITATPGNYLLTLTGTSGALEHSIEIPLEITELPPPQHQLTVNSDPITGVGFTLNGSSHSTPWSSLLDEGSYIVVMPATWTVGTEVYDFDEWEDASTNPSRTISLTADMTITAYYEHVPVTHILTVNSDPISEVDFTVDGTPYATPWSGSLSEGSHTVIMPSTWGIYDFVEWEDASTDPSRIVSLTADKTVTAYYVAREWTLTVNSDPISGVDFTVDGAPYATPWSGSLSEGSHTVIMPSTWGIYDFVEWEDTSTDPTRIMSLTDDKTVTAYYVARQWTLNVFSDPITGVNFTLDGTPHSTPWSDLLDEGSYTVVVPSIWDTYDFTYYFDHWEDMSTDPTRIISLTSDMTVTVYYVLALPQYDLTVEVVGPGTTDPAPGVYADIDEGTEVVVDALPDPDCMLDHWELDGEDVGDADPYTVLMDSDHTLTAFFVEIGVDVTPPTITINEPSARDYLHSEVITLDFYAVDTESGVASISATLNGMIVENGDTIELFTLSLGTHTLTVTAVDNAGNSATETVEFNVIATVGSLQDLVNMFFESGYFNSPKGIRTSLLQKLYAVEKLINAGEIGDAKDVLGAFINHLEAQSGKHVSEYAAYILITDAQYVKDNL